MEPRAREFRNTDVAVGWSTHPVITPSTPAADFPSPAAVCASPVRVRLNRTYAENVFFVDQLRDSPQRRPVEIHATHGDPLDLL